MQISDPYYLTVYASLIKFIKTFIKFIKLFAIIIIRYGVRLRIFMKFAIKIVRIIERFQTELLLHWVFNS